MPSIPRDSGAAPAAAECEDGANANAAPADLPPSCRPAALCRPLRPAPVGVALNIARVSSRAASASAASKHAISRGRQTSRRHGDGHLSLLASASPMAPAARQTTQMVLWAGSFSLSLPTNLPTYLPTPTYLSNSCASHAHPIPAQSRVAREACLACLAFVARGCEMTARCSASSLPEVLRSRRAFSLFGHGRHRLVLGAISEPSWEKSQSRSGFKLGSAWHRWTERARTSPRPGDPSRPRVDPAVCVAHEAQPEGGGLDTPGGDVGFR